MRSIRPILALSAIFALAGTSATGTTYYFDQVTEGDWDEEENWTPNGTPGSDDTAIIVDGHTCLVEEANQAADVVEVESGATLGIVGAKKLEVSGSGSVLTVNGTLYFDSGLGSRAPIPRLVLANAASISGTGVITGRKADGYGTGRIENRSGLTVGSDVTLAGSLQIHVDSLYNYGTFLADGSQDVLEIGYKPGAAWRTQVYSFSGSLYRASAGSIVFQRTSAGGPAASSTWEISGGTIHLTSETNWGAYPLASVYVEISNDGTLDLDTFFSTKGGLDFSDGTIKVVAGEDAYFGPQ